MKYRKKPVVVDAIQFTKEMAEGNTPLPDGIRFCRRETRGGVFPDYMMAYENHEVESLRELANYDHYHKHVIKTLEGDMEVKINDWIITGVKGEKYPCKPDIFEQTYEPA